MADAGERAAGGPGFDPRAARTGLALLQLQATASDPLSQPGWVYRRVQQLEFLDTRAVRWRVSVDFVVPQDAPELQLGNQMFYLVPITSLAKTDLVAFSLRDEQSGAVWMPTSSQTTDYLASALAYWASTDLGTEPQDLPDGLVRDIRRVISERPAQLAAEPPALLLAAELIDARHSYHRAARRLKDVQARLEQVPRRSFRQRLRLRGQRSRARRGLNAALRARLSAERKLHDAAADITLPVYRLMASVNFRSRVEELAQNFVVHVGASTPPGSRRIIKLSYESDIRFARPKGRLLRLWQSLGWRCWQVDVLIGGRGGSHHLEVAAPAGVDVVGITADRVAASADPDVHGRRPWWRQLGIIWRPDAAFSAPGYSPHVHINPPGGALHRYRAAIFVRVSRPGWLTASWLVALVIGAVIGIGRFSLHALYSNSATGEAGTAATLLLALLGVVATMLVRAGEHPLAARLLLVARLLILVQVAVVLIGIGNLVLHSARHPVPVTLWTCLAIAAGAGSILFTVSWLLPIALRP